MSGDARVIHAERVVELHGAFRVHFPLDVVRDFFFDFRRQRIEPALSLRQLVARDLLPFARNATLDVQRTVSPTFTFVAEAEAVSLTSCGPSSTYTIACCCLQPASNAEEQDDEECAAY